MSSKHKKKQHLQLALENDTASDQADAAKLTADQHSNDERRSGQDRRRSGERRKETNQLGTARGIETMFRNAYRAQLDLLALAATKANIMISVNGFILSVLLFSGAYFIISQPLFVIPTAMFLLTCMISIIFAVLAAQPKKNKSNPRLEDFKCDRANLLIFEQFSQLSEDDFMIAMVELMQNNDRIYKNMAGQMYFLGKTADRKFKLLHVSYTTFISGLFITFITVLIIGMSLYYPDLITSVE